MGKFIVFLLACAGVGYFFFAGDTTEVEVVTTTDTPALGGTVAAAADDTGAVADGQPTGTGAGAVFDDAATFTAALEAAEQQWDAYTATKTDATLHDMAPTLARTLSGLLQQTYNKPALHETQMHLINDRLMPLSQRIFFSSKTYKKDTSGLFSTYAIKSGDNLDAIGRIYGMSYEMINILRGKGPQNEVYGLGEELKLINAKKQGYVIHIDKSDYYMDVFVRDVFIKRYPIGHGAVETETPTGTTYIRARVLHPQWTNPKTGDVFDYGQKGHILGPVWLAFDKEIGKAGLGIHGYTGAGASTGIQASNGCIRMQNADALEMYNIMVKTSTKGGFLSRAPMKVEIVD